MHAETAADDQKQRDQFDDECRRGGNGGAHDAEGRDEQQAAKEIQREHANVDQGADFLFPQHVEEPVGGAHGGAREDADGKDEQQWIALREHGAEQIKNRLPQQQHQGGQSERRPEGPADGIGEEGRQLPAVSGDVKPREIMRGSRRHRIIDKPDESEHFRRREIDRDFLRRAEGLQHEHVHIGEQKKEAADHEDGQRDSEPFLEIIGRGPARDFVPELSMQDQVLNERRCPNGDQRGHHRRHGVGGKSGEIGDRHQRKNHDLPNDVARRQREAGPIVGARDAALRQRQSVERQYEAREIERQHGCLADPRLQRSDGDRGEGGDHGCETENEPAAAANEAAQKIETLRLRIGGNETLRAGFKSEIDKAADQENPCPDIDVDSEFVRAHPSCQKHLEGQPHGAACRANEERGARETLRARTIAAIGQRSPDRACPSPQKRQ